MATHSSILAWKIPRTEEPGRLQSMGSQKLETTEQLTFSLFTVYLLRFLYMSVGVVVKISSAKFLLSIWVTAAMFGDRMEVESAPPHLIQMGL